MATPSAAHPEVKMTPGVAIPSLWSSLSRRQVLEMTVPGIGIGVLSGLIAGALAAMGGLSFGLIVLAAVSLGLPLALGGAVYDLLVSMGRIPLGPLGPMALFWLIGFPLARVLNASIVNLAAGDAIAVRHGWLDFVVFNMLLSTGFAMGFWWFHQTYAPRWYTRIRGHNPLADYFMGSQLKFVAWQQEQRIVERDERKAKRADKRAARANRASSDDSPAVSSDDDRKS